MLLQGCIQVMEPEETDPLAPSLSLPCLMRSLAAWTSHANFIFPWHMPIMEQRLVLVPVRHRQHTQSVTLGGNATITYRCVLRDRVQAQCAVLGDMHELTYERQAPNDARNFVSTSEAVTGAVYGDEWPNIRVWL